MTSDQKDEGAVVAEEPHVNIFDTTLRDGAQTQGVQFSAGEKHQIAAVLDALGLDYIENKLFLGINIGEGEIKDRPHQGEYPFFFGEQQRLVHAVLDLLRPSVMIVDEPAQGLDADDLAGLVRLIRRRSARGRCYLLISHRAELAAASHRHLAVDGGRIVEVPG